MDNAPLLTDLLQASPYLLQCSDLDYYAYNTHHHIPNIRAQLKEAGGWRFDTNPCSGSERLKLVLHDIPKPSWLCDRDKLTRAVAAQTWLGSQTYEGRTAKLTVQDGGYTYFFRPPTALPNVWTKHAMQLPGSSPLLITVASRMGKGLRHRHAQYGTLPPQALQYFPSQLPWTHDLEMTIELQNTRCKFFHEIELLPADVLEDIGHRMREHLVPRLATDVGFLTHLKSCAESLKRESARKLNARKREVEKAPKLILDGEELFTVPENENETLCVFLKLEAMHGLPLRIKILEYTPRDGIDAIGHFRLTEASAETRYACIEFEYALENFFEHGHPVEQTDLVICWDYDADAYPLGEVGLREVNPWWLELAFPTKTIPALIISRIPTILENENT